jgi:hypothetical protein
MTTGSSSNGHWQASVPASSSTISPARCSPAPASPARHSARNYRCRRADRVLLAPAPTASIMPERPRTAALRPIRARTRSLRACFRRPGPYTATLSGAVCAGSNPAGGAAQRHKFKHSNNLGPVEAEAVTCGDAQAVRIMSPSSPRKEHGDQQKSCPEALHANGMQAVALHHSVRSQAAAGEAVPPPGRLSGHPIAPRCHPGDVHSP